MKSFFKKLLLLLLFTQTIFADNSLRIIPPQSKYDSSHNYFYELLSLILEETKDKYDYKSISFSKKMEQGRAFVSLKNDIHIDIHWAGTSLEREDEFITIKIPLIKGMLGYRFFVINKDKKSAFDKIKSFDDLKKLKACQGTHWPDTKILLNAGIPVVKNAQYELMFAQVQRGRCDYFPRGIHEITSEIEARRDRYPELIIYENLMIYYPFPMYFFVSKNNKKLATQIENGLVKIINNGKFDELLKSHETTKHLFPLKNWINTKAFKLDNPFMKIDEKFYNKKFWIKTNY